MNNSRNCEISMKRKNRLLYSPSLKVNAHIGGVWRNKYWGIDFKFFFTLLIGIHTVTTNINMFKSIFHNEYSILSCLLLFPSESESLQPFLNKNLFGPKESHYYIGIHTYNTSNIGAESGWGLWSLLTRTILTITYQFICLPS